MLTVPVRITGIEPASVGLHATAKPTQLNPHLSSGVSLILTFPGITIASTLECLGELIKSNRIAKYVYYAYRPKESQLSIRAASYACQNFSTTKES